MPVVAIRNQLSNVLSDKLTDVLYLLDLLTHVTTAVFQSIMNSRVAQRDPFKAVKYILVEFWTT
jgi:hypothetical protein